MSERNLAQQRRIQKLVYKYDTANINQKETLPQSHCLKEILDRKAGYKS